MDGSRQSDRKSNRTKSCPTCQGLALILCGQASAVEVGTAWKERLFQRWLMLLQSRSELTERDITKHLVALRVRLSTSPLAWLAAFTCDCGGLVALQQQLLSARANDPTEQQYGRTVHAESLKCLRTLMNTNVGSGSSWLFPSS